MPLNNVLFSLAATNLQLRQILTDLTANDAVYTRSHQSEWIAMTMMLSELEQCACACALPGPRQSCPWQCWPRTLAGIAACARLLTARSVTATHKFFSVDFQIFSKLTVSDVFQIQDSDFHTHTWGGTEPTKPISLCF